MLRENITKIPEKEKKNTHTQDNVNYFGLANSIKLRFHPTIVLKFDNGDLLHIKFHD